MNLIETCSCLGSIGSTPNSRVLGRIEVNDCRRHSTLQRTSRELNVNVRTNGLICRNILHSNSNVGLLLGDEELVSLLAGEFPLQDAGTSTITVIYLISNSFSCTNLVGQSDILLAICTKLILVEVILVAFNLVVLFELLTCQTQLLVEVFLSDVPSCSVRPSRSCALTIVDVVATFVGDCLVYRIRVGNLDTDVAIVINLASLLVNQADTDDRCTANFLSANLVRAVSGLLTIRGRSLRTECVTVAGDSSVSGLVGSIVALIESGQLELVLEVCIECSVIELVVYTLYILVVSLYELTEVKCLVPYAVNLRGLGCTSLMNGLHQMTIVGTTG